jgi:hypothetical protein
MPSLSGNTPSSLTTHAGRAPQRHTPSSSGDICLKDVDELEHSGDIRLGGERHSLAIALWPPQPPRRRAAPPRLRGLCARRTYDVTVHCLHVCHDSRSAAHLHRPTYGSELDRAAASTPPALIPIVGAAGGQPLCGSPSPEWR